MHYPVEPDPAEQQVIKGRPLFMRQLSQITPGPDNYDIKRNVGIEPINLKRPCFFGHSYNSYRRTCDIQKGIKVFDYAAEKTNAAGYYPNVESTKRHWPGYSQSRAKQFTLWEAEEKKSLVTPGPLSYDQTDKAVKPARFDGVSLGMDMKCTARLIKLTPGPGDYDNIMKLDSAVVKKSHNYMYNNYGGIPKPTTMQNHKDFLIAQSFNLGRGSTNTERINSAKKRVMSGLSRRSNQMYGSKKALNNVEGDKIHEKVVNTRVINTNQMNSTNGFSEGPLTVAARNAGAHYTKADAQSDSMAQSVTKYSKNPETDVEMSVQNPVFLQRDLSNPRAHGSMHKKLQYSTDFTKTGRRKKLVQGGGQQLIGDFNVQNGYETENLHSPGGLEGVFKFGGS